ncbi:iduronate 2-sulfatase-like [Diadema setosum]|uniref:iduronate 2-sulfatase-like n=1 Tax=Diadema setosum TaxID=31175 RepID=UPI003B3B297D
MCPVNVTEMPEETLPDIQSLETAENLLKIVSALESPNDHLFPELRSFLQAKGHDMPGRTWPFFLAVGFRKPHIPWKYPKEFRALYPLDSIEIAPNPNIPEKLPSVAWENYYQLRLRDDIKALNLSFPYGTIPLKYHAVMRRGYYAAASYTDYLVGRLLQALEETGHANNTIISLVGDHGWFLGEHGEWCKCSNYELATKVPLLVHVPNVTDSRLSLSPKFPLIDVRQSVRDFRRQHTRKKTVTAMAGGRERFATQRNGLQIEEMVELVDLFPTLTELTRLSAPPICPETSFNITLCTEGVSFVPLIKRTKRFARWKNATFSQYPRPGVEPVRHTDLPALDKITIMGYSMRTRDYHYTEWISFNHTTFERDWSDVKARELYFNEKDPEQNDNVADDAGSEALVKVLSQQLRRGWRDCLPEHK